jgi:iron complex outermembrane receptor protein
LSWTNSARIDFVSPGPVGAYVYNTITAYSFNSGLVYKAGTDDTFRVLVGRSNQLPSMLMILRVPGIKPSSLMKYQGTWDHAFPSIGSTLHASVYHQVLARVIDYGVLNVGDSSSTGFEASFEGANKDGWHWETSLNYRAVANDLSVVPPGPVGIAINFNKTTPKCILTFGGGKSWGNFEVDVQGKWVSKSQDWAPVWAAKTFVNVPDYMTMNARIGYRISDNFTVAVTAQQFNSETVFEGANDPDKRRFMVTLTSTL